MPGSDGGIGCGEIAPLVLAERASIAASAVRELSGRCDQDLWLRHADDSLTACQLSQPVRRRAEMLVRLQKQGSRHQDVGRELGVRYVSKAASQKRRPGSDITGS